VRQFYCFAIAGAVTYIVFRQVLQRWENKRPITVHSGIELFIEANEVARDV